jgi:cellulose synthase/poly-beta-1,6-N-acetylglucosamine synthase-like glycosyltransferase
MKLITIFWLLVGLYIFNMFDAINVRKINEKLDQLKTEVAVTNYTQVFIPQTNEGPNQTIKLPYFYIEKDGERIEAHLAVVTYSVADDRIFVSSMDIFYYGPSNDRYELKNRVWKLTEYSCGEYYSNRTIQPSEMSKEVNFVRATNDFWKVMHGQPVDLEVK